MPTNRLIHESSPYLSQHGHNPVDWYPWCEEAFAKAKQENKPVLLSIGYSACHWCHVMESESFENEAIAALMNRHFVSIKVDREERPDLDEIYMNAVQMMTGHGGWPMTVFLTPDGKPFYGGTYFPPEDRHNMPGFPRVLEAVAQAYREKPQDVEKNVREVLAAMSRMNALKETRETLSLEVLEAGAQGLARSYDASHGGFGRAPKFPNAGVYNLFLRCYKISKNQHYLEMVTETLTQMARGGIYDHLGGGFHRYSVDEKWLVPHFEKMLYDNAQLLQVYVDVFRITREDFFKQVVEQTMEYLLREMFDTNGGFYSTQDADSEGHEGKFFVWTPAEVRNLVGEEASEIFCRVYDVSDAGNFEGHNILHPILTTAQAARYFKKPESEIHAILADAKQRLFAEREKRVKPFRDEKILTSWNGLMLSGIAHAYGITHSSRYRDAALKTVEFIFSRMFKDGLLLHTYKDGRAKLLGYLDDYAFLVAGLLDVYEATFERAPLQRAEELCRKMIEEFWDDIDGGFYYTGRSHEKLISRTKPAFDSSIPSGNSVGAQVLMRLYHYTGDEDFQARGEKLLRLNYDGMVQQPFGLSTMLGVLDFYLSKPQEIVVVADRNEPGATELLHRIHLSYLPNKTLQVVPASESLEQASPLLAGKTQVDGKPTVYVCHNFTCSPPFTEWDDSR